MNGSRSKFLPKSIRRPISQNHHKPSKVLGEVWNSYGRAKPTQTNPRMSERKLGSNTKQIADLSAWTGLTGATDRSDRSWPEQVLTGLTGLAVQSDQCHPEKPVNKTSKEESRANEVQIQRNLEDTSATNLRTYPKRSFPKDQRNLRI